MLNARTTNKTTSKITTTTALAWAPLAIALIGGCAMFGNKAQSAASDQVGAAMLAMNAEKFGHTEQERDQFIAQQTEGYEPAGDPVGGRLESFEPVPVAVERGRCYTMVLRLDDGAEFSELAKKGLAFVYSAPEGPEISGGPGVHGPGGVASAGCPLEDAAMTFQVKPALDDPNSEGLGKGPYTLQLLAKPISEEQLVALEADQEQQIADQRERAAQRAAERASKACRGCQDDYLTCLRTTARAQCSNERDTCVYLKGDLGSYAECS